MTGLPNFRSHLLCYLASMVIAMRTKGSRTSHLRLWRWQWEIQTWGKYFYTLDIGLSHFWWRTLCRSHCRSSSWRKVKKQSIVTLLGSEEWLSFTVSDSGYILKQLQQLSLLMTGLWSTDPISLSLNCGKSTTFQFVASSPSPKLSKKLFLIGTTGFSFSSSYTSSPANRTFYRLTLIKECLKVLPFQFWPTWYPLLSWLPLQSSMHRALTKTVSTTLLHHSLHQAVSHRSPLLSSIPDFRFLLPQMRY